MMYSVNREVLVFENAEALMDFMNAGNTIHLVLSEIHLHGRSGFELLRFLKQKQAGTYFIAISTDPVDEISATELGADAFLAKPFALTDLFDIVQRFVVESPDACQYKGTMLRN
jgi:DNA-binding response OmpR family regulator